MIATLTKQTVRLICCNVISQISKGSGRRGIHTKSSANADEVLKSLCDSDQQLLDAVSFLILLEPSRQIPQLGGEETLIQKAKSFEETSDYLMARVNYETLARISLYRSRVDEAKNYIAKCQKMADGRRLERYRFIFQNFDRVSNVVKQYYEKTGV